MYMIPWYAFENLHVREWPFNIGGGGEVGNFGQPLK